jgi:hypothetical protein
MALRPPHRGATVIDMLDHAALAVDKVRGWFRCPAEIDFVFWAEHTTSYSNGSEDPEIGSR